LFRRGLEIWDAIRFPSPAPENRKIHVDLAALIHRTPPIRSQGQGFCAKAIIKIALKELANDQYPRENEPLLGATRLVNGEKVPKLPVLRVAFNGSMQH
jgi:hypothetical protein